MSSLTSLNALGGGGGSMESRDSPMSLRRKLYDVVEPNEAPTKAERLEREESQLTFSPGAWARAGLWLEKLMIVVIFLNTLAFILSTDEDIIAASPWLKAVFEVIEVGTVVLFTAEYLLRLCVIGEHDKFGGPFGLVRYMVSPFALVDLASIIPFYIDLLTPEDDLPALQFIRLLRLLRIMMTGAYGAAFRDMSKAVTKNASVLMTSGFAGVAIWLSVASLYYVTERNNPNTIWTFDEGTDPSFKLHPGNVHLNNTQLFASIPESMFFSLLNLFGEFPLVSDHSTGGRFVAVFTAIFAVAIFGIPVGILGDGFGDAITERMEQRAALKLRRHRLKAAFDRADADRSGAISKAELWDCMQSLGYEFSHEEVLVMAEEADIDGDGSIDYREFSFLLESKFKGEFRTRKEPPQSPAPGQAVGARAAVYRLLHPSGLTAARADVCSRLAPRLEGALSLLIFLNVVAFAFSTMAYARKSESIQWALQIFEWVSVGIFLLEWTGRLWTAPEERRYNQPLGRLWFALSFYSLVDLLSIVPTLVDPFIPGDQPSATFLRALRLLRLLRGTGYSKSLSRYVATLSSCMPTFQLTFAIAMVTWVFFSVLLYYAERYNPDPDMRKHYKSVPEAMWVTLLNLSGEAPLCNYQTWGRLIEAAVGLFATAFFAIPVGVLAGAFEKDFGLDDDDEEEEEGAVASQDGQGPQFMSCFGTSAVSAPPRLDTPPWRADLAALVQAQTPQGVWFERVVFSVIGLSILQAALDTVPLMEDDKGTQTVFFVIEATFVGFFTIEYLLRLAACPEFEEYRGYNVVIARCKYMMSFYSLVDLLAIVPWYLARVSTTVDQYDHTFRLIRILRLLTLDKYYPGMSLLDDVIRRASSDLSVAAFVASVTWIVFASLLYITENKNTTEDADRPEGERFADVPTALSYTLILLSGDYPLIEFTWPGRLVNFFMIICAQAIVGIPTAITIAGFQTIVQEARDAKRAALELAGTPEQRRIGPGPGLGGQGLMATGMVSKGRQVVHDLLNLRQKALSKWYAYGIGALIVLNVIAVLAESVQDFAATMPDGFFSHFETFSVAVFTLEFLGRLWCAPLCTEDRQGYTSRLGYLTSFYGVVDLITILPFYADSILDALHSPLDATDLRVFRVFRVFQLEHFIGSFTLLDDAFRRCQSNLAAFGLVALIIWVGGASLFYVFESSPALQPIDEMRESFDSVPSAMYFLAVFLGGEWGLTDFSVPGKVLCIMLVAIGIQLYAIPISVLFDAFQEVLDDEGQGDGEEGDGQEKQGLLAGARG